MNELRAWVSNTRAPAMNAMLARLEDPSMILVTLAELLPDI
jgi:hypothetical protein